MESNKRNLLKSCAALWAAAVVVFMQLSALAATEFTEFGSEQLRFIGQSEYYDYLLLGGLYEIDRETGEVMHYPEYTGDCFVGVDTDGRVTLIDHTGQWVTTDLYEKCEVKNFAGEKETQQYAIYDEYFYYCTSDMKLYCMDMTSRKEVKLLENVWPRFMIADREGLWYTDGAGLYLIARDEKEPRLIVDEAVGYFQRSEDTIYYIRADKGTIWKYDMKDGKQLQMISDRSAAVAVDAQGRYAVTIARTGKYACWHDLEKQSRVELTLMPGEEALALNALNGKLYLMTIQAENNEYGGAMYAAYRVEEGALTLVYAETNEE